MGKKRNIIIACIIAFVFLTIGIFIGREIIMRYELKKTMESAFKDVFRPEEKDSVSSTEPAEKEIKAIDINLYEKMTAKNFEFTITKYAFAQEINPPNPNDLSTNVKVDNSDNTYLYLIVNVYNTSTQDLDIDTILNTEALYDNKYTFSSNVQEATNCNFNQFSSIKQLNKAKLYYFIEIPRTVEKDKKHLFVYLKDCETNYKLKIK